ncbi:protein adenylyltransferase SelO [Paenibacillus sp. MMS18-CY102]|uniref:protein adenylyltransferase SelO n=1 Tax=Paenibacillus sp. MMS18-CY102 TaxID=2682849 RepID=UPI001365ABCC|nr:YdiU family protein [Paenibacillus sp. MMS18-CY102]MWC28243.1 YdiU family protein [Paenibacillus sp. MMS18-CY102]
MTDNQSRNDAGWNFDNSYKQLPNVFFTLQLTNPVNEPKLVKLNERLAASLGLNAQALASKEGVASLSGNGVPEGGAPLSQAYAGHQFGHFNILGDGRALLLGEQITPEGKRFDIQLKGSGRTPYSRGGDGRAALGPMLREYIISESMYALGIPTTRSLAVVETGEPVYRETELEGAILTRVAASHLRVGTFQYARATGTVEDLQALADYAVERHFPEVKDQENRYLGLLQEVIKRQAALIAKWQLVGFIHGVMNTDNMAISGETIDYGPCAFMDVYDPATVFSSIDAQGRYAYGNQPKIGVWNLARFAETLLQLLNDDEEKAVEMAEAELARYYDLHHGHWLAGMRAKLGFANEEPEDESLIERLLELMKAHRADYTNTFRALTYGEPVEAALAASAAYEEWHQVWQARLSRQEADADSNAIANASQQLMQASNPTVIPRNHRVEEAIQAAVKDGDYSVMDRLLSVLSAPFAHSAEHAAYAAVPERADLPYRTFCGT